MAKYKLDINKGISLIVLVITIIVIIILTSAIVLSISSNNPIKSAQEAVFKSDIKNMQDEVNVYMSSMIAQSSGALDVRTVTGPLSNYLGAVKPEYASMLSVEAGTLVIKDTATQAQKDLAIQLGINTAEYIKDEGVNRPKLVTGMVAKKWNGTNSTWDTVTDPDTDTTWYNYDSTNKQWANAQTVDGSMWVWIPRYEYKIPTVHSSNAQTVQINFLAGTSSGLTSGYTVHPGFTFGTVELTGIWVAKFEASGVTNAVDIKPGVSALRNMSVDSIFTECRNIESNNRYGWTSPNGIDTHLMKNIEWGTAAYLSSSIYGKNNIEVAMNLSSSYYTGGNSGAAYVTNTAQSTTGNIYGIYDMAGGSWEYMAAYINNGNSNLTTYGASLLNASSKYKDVYTKGSIDDAEGNYIANLSKVGDVSYETSVNGSASTSWYADYSGTPYGGSPFFRRGGANYNGTDGGMFSFNSYSGVGYDVLGFRPVLLVASNI